MSFRRIIASFLVFLFVIVALPTFVVYGLDKTFFDSSFYVNNVTEPAYELLVNAVAFNIYSKNPLVQKYFQQDDVHKIVAESISLDLFKTSMQDFASDFDAIKTQPNHPLSFNLKPYQASLEKIGQRMAMNIFQALPQCKGNELPQFNEDGIATCVPGGTNYDVVSAPLAQQFQTGVSAALPDTVDLSLARDQNGSTITYILNSAEQFKFYGIAALMVFIVVIAFAIYRPFNLIVRYEGIAFLFSGFLGFLMSIGLMQVPFWLVQTYAEKNGGIIKTLGGPLVLAQSFQKIFSVFTGEVQKISFVFLGLGAVLLFIYFFFLRKEAKRIKN